MTNATRVPFSAEAVNSLAIAKRDHPFYADYWGVEDCKCETNEFNPKSANPLCRDYMEKIASASEETLIAVVLRLGGNEENDD